MINTTKIKEGRYFSNRKGEPIRVDRIEKRKIIIEVEEVIMVQTDNHYIDHTQEWADYGNEIFLDEMWLSMLGFLEGNKKSDRYPSFGTYGTYWSHPFSLDVRVVEVKGVFVVCFGTNDKNVIPIKTVNELQDVFLEHTKILLVIVNRRL